MAKREIEWAISYLIRLKRNKSKLELSKVGRERRRKERSGEKEKGRSKCGRWKGVNQSGFWSFPVVEPQGEKEYFSIGSQIGQLINLLFSYFSKPLNMRG